MSTPTSNIGLISLAMKSLLYTKFATTMGLTNQNTDISFYPSEIAYRETMEKKGKDILNFISFWVRSFSPALERRRLPTGLTGLSLASASGEGIITGKAFPVNLNYDIDFWVHPKGLDTLMQVVDDYFYWLYSNPNINLTFNGYELPMQLFFSGLEDTSPHSQRYNDGKYLVYRTSIKVDGWLVRFDSDWEVTSIHCKGYENTNATAIEVWSKIIP